jgi:glucokinase
MQSYVLAADLGGTNLRMAAVSEKGAILSHALMPTPDAVSSSQLGGLLDQLAEECRDGIKGVGQLSAVGMGVPAPVPANFDGILTKLPNIRTLQGTDLGLLLKEVFNVPFHIENDATAAAIGEHWLGATREIDSSICVTLGTGIGGGLILNGQPLRGRDGSGGEMGHICVEPEGHPCGCGSRGCVEQYASATAITRIANEKGLFTNDAREVYTAFRKGDSRAVETFSTMARYLGIMLAGLVNTINPERIVLVGGVTAAWDAFAADLEAEIANRAYEAPALRAKLVRGVLGDNAGILGAARGAIDAWLE